MSLGFILDKVLEKTVAFWKKQLFSSGSCADQCPHTLGAEMSFSILSEMQRCPPALMGICGVSRWILGENAAENFQGRDDACQGKATAADGFGDQSRGIELISQFIWAKACPRRGDVFHGCSADAFCILC